MRKLLAIALILFAAAPLRAEGEAAASAAQNGGRQVRPGWAYGGAIFSGMFTGALVGAAVGAYPYATERKSQDPQTVILGAVYGAVGGAIGLGTPCAAYEVGSDKPGSAKRILFNTFGFAFLGGVVGGAGGMISYRRKVDYDPSSAEDFLGAAAAGVVGGAVIGLGVGVADGIFYEPGLRIPGKGIHARLGVVELASARMAPEGPSAMPNVTLAKVDF